MYTSYEGGTFQSISKNANSGGKYVNFLKKIFSYKFIVFNILVNI